MKGFILLAVFLTACASPAPQYSAYDPLAGNAAPQPVRRNGKIIFTSIIPKDYTATEGRLSKPLLEIFQRDVYWGKSSISIEQYLENDGAPALASFARALHPSKPQPTMREIQGKKLSVYHDLRFTSYGRQISQQDPSSGILGTNIRPPKLDPTGKRRFPKGGDAYRLHRCKKIGAWGILSDEIRARVGRKKEESAPPMMKRRDRRILVTCFGRNTLDRLLAGKSVGTIPKPSSGKLKLMGKDEWEHGSARRIDRECVHLRKLKDGFAAIRFRAPDHAFDDQHEAWEVFLGSLTFPTELP